MGPPVLGPVGVGGDYCGGRQSLEDRVLRIGAVVICTDPGNVIQARPLHQPGLRYGRGVRQTRPRDKFRVVRRDRRLLRLVVCLDRGGLGRIWGDIPEIEDIVSVEGVGLHRLPRRLDAMIVNTYGGFWAAAGNMHESIQTTTPTAEKAKDFIVAVLDQNADKVIPEDRYFTAESRIAEPGLVRDRQSESGLGTLRQPVSDLRLGWRVEIQHSWVDWKVDCGVCTK
ncbi:hypothetical protein C8R44DRAFT_852109, partial [Mycena epipterygia]